MKIKVDPTTDVSGFGYAPADEYRLRVVSVELKEGQKAPYLAWKFEFADPNVESVEKKEDGSNKQLGSIFDNTTLKEGDNAQFRLRQLCDAVGVEWGDEIDTENLIGLEFNAFVDLDEYQGTIKNVVKRYIPQA